VQADPPPCPLTETGKRSRYQWKTSNWCVPHSPASPVESAGSSRQLSSFSRCRVAGGGAPGRLPRPLPLHRDEVAHRVGAVERPRELVDGVGPGVHAGLEDPVARARRPRDRLAVLDGVRHRRLEVDVLARVQRRLRELAVLVRGRRDADRVDRRRRRGPRDASVTCFASRGPTRPRPEPAARRCRRSRRSSRPRSRPVPR
jgi:hypothetical protein